jgi:hypothetical protein
VAPEDVGGGLRGVFGLVRTGQLRAIGQARQELVAVAQLRRLVPGIEPLAQLGRELGKNVRPLGGFIDGQLVAQHLEVGAQHAPGLFTTRCSCITASARRPGGLYKAGNKGKRFEAGVGRKRHEIQASARPRKRAGDSGPYSGPNYRHVVSRASRVTGWRFSPTAVRIKVKKSPSGRP